MNSFWEDWVLFHPVTFDGENKLIIVNDGVTNLSIQIDTYSSWKEWIAIRDYAKFLPALRTIGGDPTTLGQRAGDIYFTINGWRLVVDLSKTRVDGVLFSDNFDTPLLNKDTLSPVYSNMVSSLITRAATVDLSSLSIPSATQNAAAVWNAMFADFMAANTFGNRVQDTPIITAGLIPPTPTPAQVADAVWDETLTDHTLSGSTGLALAQTNANAANSTLDIQQVKTLVELLLKYETNRTKIDKVAKTLTVYDNNGTTVLKVFNLKDSTGVPSVDEIAERVPV